MHLTPGAWIALAAGTAALLALALFHLVLIVALAVARLVP